ncbi:hypothetical protein U2P60_13570 [Brucella sp. H1_1004]|uniref:hypothetical protein n=1 Tax=Brucella sp. H1_1004 TaxID=3110109 RepID=UPI0039B48512
MKNLVLIAAASVALTGCVSQQQVDNVMASQRPPSAAIKAEIVKDARDYLIDPYSVRDAEISSVMDVPGGKMQFVCVKANARNAMGGYTGRKTISIRLVGSRPVSTNPNAAACGMPLLRWYPFKELENLKNT